MSRRVIVYYQTPEGVKSFEVDLDHPKVHAAGLTEDVRLYADTRETPPLYIKEVPRYRRRPDIEKADGWVRAEIEGPDDRISPEAWADTRWHWTASEEEAQALAQQHRGVQLADLFPAATPQEGGQAPATPGAFGASNPAAWDTLVEETVRKLRGKRRKEGRLTRLVRFFATREGHKTTLEGSSQGSTSGAWLIFVASKGISGPPEEQPRKPAVPWNAKSALSS
jgi:hypothetical protein